MDILELIDKAIESGKYGSFEIYDHSETLDSVLGTDPISYKVRNFFDSWSDAIGHDYQPYLEKRAEEWVAAAYEIKMHFCEQKKLSNRAIWAECGINDV